MQPAPPTLAGLTTEMTNAEALVSCISSGAALRPLQWARARAVLCFWPETCCANNKMEPVVLLLGLAASFVLSLGLARALLLSILRLARIGEQLHHPARIRTATGAVQNDLFPADLLGA